MRFERTEKRVFTTKTAKNKSQKNEREPKLGGVGESIFKSSLIHRRNLKADQVDGFVLIN